MIELLVIGALVLAAVLVFSVLGAVLSLLFGLLILPFKLLGLVFKGVGFLIALPFLAAGGILFAVLCGVGLIAAFTPLLPLVLAVALVVWLVRRRRPAVA